uniref:Uncharacterized protein n=1 Tax=Cucumis melo TaxID=3656 RepID=A0A9I9EKW0_CUCME
MRVVSRNPTSQFHAISHLKPFDISFSASSPLGLSWVESIFKGSTSIEKMEFSTLWPNIFSVLKISKNYLEGDVMHIDSVKVEGNLFSVLKISKNYLEGDVMHIDSVKVEGNL